jgi:hypothetical protein
VSAIELLVLASAMAFVGVGGGVGVKLLWLGRRTHGFPERVVGFSLLALSGVAWPLMLAARAEALPAPLLRAALAGASLAMALGWSGVFLFTWRVFRPGPGWARTLAGVGISVQLAAGLAGAIRALASPDAAMLRAPAPSGLVLLLGAQGVYAWTAVESFRYRALLRRRIPLGLADPVVADRFGLWGWTGVLGGGSIAPATWAMLRGGDPNSLASHLVVGLCGLACSGVLYLAFLPPAAYTRFVRENAPAPSGGAGP